MKTKTSLTMNSMKRSPLRRALFLIPVVLGCFALLPTARGVCQDACLTNDNTVQGDDALLNLTTGTDNTALGFNALLSDTTGNGNTAVGSQALVSNTSGIGNLAIGTQTLFSNTTADSNVAIGGSTMYNNASGNNNTAVGAAALFSNQGGSQNVAIGYSAAFYNETGVNNTAVGASALFNNISGSNNCIFGYWAFLEGQTGSNNTAVGMNALLSTFGDNNVAIGYNAGLDVQGGDNNIFIGASAGHDVVGSGSNNIEIGTVGNGTDNGQIRIGKKGVQTVVHIAGIAGSTVASGVAVITDNLGHLGTVTSSARFKENIQPMDKASEAILSLKPVTFRYKKDLDPEAIPQFGLVAEQVERVNPALVAYDNQGKPYSVRYEAVNAMLLNEFLKAHRKIEEQECRAQQQDSTLAELRSQVQTLTAALKEQTERIQKVSAQLELSRPTPKTVMRDH